MANTRPVYWYEGLFLRPQHFQQQDLYLQQLVKTFASYVQPYGWGVGRLSLLESVLPSQVLEVEQAQIIFSDGTVIRYPGNCSVERRNFDQAWDAKGNPIDVYLGVKRLSAGQNNVLDEVMRNAAGDDTRAHLDTRFKVSPDQDQVFDHYAVEQQANVGLLEYRVRVFFGKEVEQAPDYEVVRVAKIEKSGNDIRLSERYIPPCLSIKASPVLSRILRDTKEQLTTRARELTLYKREKGIESAEFGSRDMVYLLVLQSLGRAIPFIHQCLENEDRHAWDLYAFIRQLIGELSVFSAQVDMLGGDVENPGDPGLPRYNHDDLYSCFGQASELLITLLDEVVSGPDYVANLVYDGTYYYADLSERIFKGNNRYFLCVTSEMPVSDVVRAMESIAKLSSREGLPILIARSLAGVPMVYTESPPGQLPRRSDRVYFELEKSGDAWSALRESMNAAVYFDAPFEGLQIELMVLYGS